MPGGCLGSHCCWIEPQRGRLGSTEEPATSDVMEGGKQEVMVVNGFQLSRRAGPSTGRRCVSVCEQSRKGLFCNSFPDFCW